MSDAQAVLRRRSRKAEQSAARTADPGSGAVREEWRQYVRSLTGVVSRHSKEIDEYIQNHGPMTRPEVIERALTKLLSEV